MIPFDHLGSRASTEWLTSVLTANGHLYSGEVASVHQQMSRIGTTLTSTFYQLDITYSSDFSGNAPSSCLLKVGMPERFSINKVEAAFYDRAARLEGRNSGLLTAFATAVD